MIDNFSAQYRTALKKVGWKRKGITERKKIFDVLRYVQNPE
jgi:hypothetical protein